jgi:hypothetical protein
MASGEKNVQPTPAAAKINPLATMIRTLKERLLKSDDTNGVLASKNQALTVENRGLLSEKIRFASLRYS